MKTITLEYESLEQLKRFIQSNKICNEENILIQIFTAINEESFVNYILKTLKDLVPQAKIIGTSTSGEISNNGSLSDSTVISFSMFNKTKLQTVLIDYDESSFNTGTKIINGLQDNKSEELKLIISFADGLNINGENYMNGISSVNDKIVIAGGLAGDNSEFKKTIVFTQDGISAKGAVAVGLYNKDLNIHTDYSFNWESVGKKHTITKAKQNRVYEISGMKTIDFYKYYLGNDIADLLPAIGIEFPLVIKRNGVNIARASLLKHDDGSLSFAGNIPEGSIVQFGHGDVEMIINKGLNSVKRVIEEPIESIFIYSCMARKALLKEDINLEILPLRELAPISGCFTYGEFYYNALEKNSKPELLNQTMTLLAISEQDKIIDKVTPNIFSHNPEKINDIELHRTQALSNLIEQTTKELEELNTHLTQKVKEEIAKNEEKDSMLQMMQSQTQLGEMLEMIIHQWRQPLSAISSHVTSLQVYQETGLLDDDMLTKSLADVLSYSEHLNSTIQDFRDLFKSNMKIEMIEAKKLLQKSITVIKPLLKKHDFELIENYSCSSTINVSIGLMMQVILNIVKNAIDILIEKGIEKPSIEIKTYMEDTNWVLEIKDNGGGIPEDILAKIFEKRFTTKQGTHGTGLGLDMSKTIVESKLNGSLTAHNENNWAVFTIKIPI